jgi:hypothetical protein
VRNRIDAQQLRRGMTVYSGEGQALGTIERTAGDSITVNGQQYAFSSVERVEGDLVYLTRQVGADTNRAGAGARGAEGGGEIRVPVREERLDVSKREVELGQVEVRRHVEQEPQSVDVQLQRDEVHVERRDTADRPATEADLAGAFKDQARGTRGLHRRPQAMRAPGRTSPRRTLRHRHPEEGPTY